MRKSWAEYKREARQRQREERRAQADLVRPDLRKPFFEYFSQFGGVDLNWYAGVLGEEWFKFKDDSGIKPENDDALAQEDLEKVPDSLAKAEFLIGLFTDLTADLARSVND